MSVRVPLSLALAAAGFLGVAGAPAAEAASSSSLHFLSASQVPTSKYATTWNQTKVISGLRSQDYCWDAALPKKTTKLRAIYNDQESNYINQYAVHTSSTTAAKKLVAALQKCWPAKAVQSKTPDAGRATAKNYGRTAVKDGLWMGQQTSCGSSQFPDQSVLWAIGRDGRDVMYLQYWPGHASCTAPKSMWTALAKKALEQL